MVNLQAGKLRGTVAISAPSQRTAEPQRKNEMEWEEALLTSWAGEIPPHAAAYYRRDFPAHARGYMKCKTNLKQLWQQQQGFWFDNNTLLLLQS